MCQQPSKTLIAAIVYLNIIFYILKVFNSTMVVIYENA